jgi:hypothetical protein
LPVPDIPVTKTLDMGTTLPSVKRQRPPCARVVANVPRSPVGPPVTSVR